MPSPARARIRDLGYGPGYYTPGAQNSILDLRGLRVGQTTVHDERAGVHVGVTVVFPRGIERTRTTPCYAGIHSLNGAGELTGRYFVDEWGYTNSPIAFTDSMSLGAVYQTLMSYGWETSRALGEDPGTGYSHFGFPVCGETWGGGVTEIHDGKSTLSTAQIQAALADAATRTHVDEGGEGGGAGMLCQGFKGGTGTSSRIVPGVDAEGQALADGYTVAALVQTNYGQKQTLQIGGVPVGKLLMREDADCEKGVKQKAEAPSRVDGSEGSILVLVATDAPLLPHQLRRLALRATFGLAAVGGHGTSHNSSGDIFIAISTSETAAPQVLCRKEWARPSVEVAAGLGGNATGSADGEAATKSGQSFRRLVESHGVETVTAGTIDGLFVAAGEATEEAILNSLCAAERTVGFDGTVWEGMPLDRVKRLLDKHRVVV